MNNFSVANIPQNIEVIKSLIRGFGVLVNTSLPSSKFNGVSLAQNDAIVKIAFLVAF